MNLDKHIDFECLHHYEDTNAFQKRFTKDAISLDKALRSNPYKLDKLTLLNNHEKGRYNDSVFEDLKTIKSEGGVSLLISCKKDVFYGLYLCRHPLL